MSFWQIFVRVLPRRPLAALKSLWWHATGRRVRARNRLRIAGAQLPFAYKFWMQASEPYEELKSEAARIASEWPWRPTFVILLEVRPDDSDEIVERSLGAVRRQIYPHWTLLVTANGPPRAWIAGERIRVVERSHADAGETLVVASKDAEGDFIIPVRSGDELSSWALFRIAEAVQSEPEAKIVYGDHDQLDSAGRRTAPWFKPRWNEEMFLARDYLSGAVALKAEALRSVAAELRPGASLFEVLLVLVRAARGPIVHVPHIVAHVQARSDEDPDQKIRVEAVARHVAAAGATAAAGPFGTVRVSWPLPDDLPLASIIVPTRDKLELLRPCVESVLARTDYGHFELIVVDNGSVEQRTTRYLDEIARISNVRVLSYPGPYNYSAINNFAAGEARGTYLCLLNNDTEVVEDRWLTEMMRYAVRREIGAVGAKLLYPDGTIQHAGVVVGIGEAAGHAHRYLPDTEAGYFSQVHAAQFVSAVTGACLLVEKEKYLRVGGLDEEGLAVAYNDVDLCLKLERAGWRNVYVPHAVLIHHESKSRGKDHSPSQINRYRRELKTFQERWGAQTYQDPLLNPNLDRSSETFLIRL